MIDEEKQFIIKVNVDKAKKKMISPFLLIIVSVMSYIIPLMYGKFDFGIVFDFVSLVFLIIARIYMTNYDEIRSKRYVICAMIPVGWMLIYDLVIIFSSGDYALEYFFFNYEFYFGELLSIFYLLLLFSINKDLSKADNPTKYKESIDWFYEKYERKD